VGFFSSENFPQKWFSRYSELLPSVSKVKDGYTRSKDKMDILDLIKKDHRKIETLFSAIETTDDTQKLYECFNQLYEEINLHAEVEEQTFYPAILEYCENTEEVIDEAQNDHDEAKQLLEEIESLSPTSAEFKQKIRELKQVIQHHVQSEENQVFSSARQCITEEERSQLGSDFEAVKSQLQSDMSIMS
jgi:hemerythrin superfamily protein